MRITAGKNKGKILNSFELETTRPTSDLVKQAMFNIIGYKINNCSFLDLFGGTGAIACEAISRGAEKVVVVDNNKESIKIINKNLQLIKANNATVINDDFLNVLSKLNKENMKFDIIFLDPPYKSNCAEQSVNFILENNILNSNGMLIWEHSVDKLLNVEKYKIFKTKKYGIKFLSYFTKD